MKNTSDKGLVSTIYRNLSQVEIKTLIPLRKEASQMNQQIKVGIIGDYDPKTFFSHISTNEALSHAASALSAVAPQGGLGSDLIIDFKRNEESLTGKCQNLATILTWFLNGCKARSCPKQPVQNKLFEPLHGFSNRLKRR